MICKEVLAVVAGTPDDDADVSRVNCPTVLPAGDAVVTFALDATVDNGANVNWAGDDLAVGGSVAAFAVVSSTNVDSRPVVLGTRDGDVVPVEVVV